MGSMDRIGQTCKTMQNIDDLSIALLLGILGISITIFTVVYSFMESTKEKKRLLHERANANAREVDPVLMAELIFATKYLTDLWKINKFVISIIIAVIMILILYIFHLFYYEIVWIWYFVLILEVVLIVGCLYTLYAYLKLYYERFSKMF